MDESLCLCTSEVEWFVLDEVVAEESLELLQEIEHGYINRDTSDYLIHYG
jgi:hypothetical protein